MLDYYELRAEIKALLLTRWQQLDIATDPLVWAWLAHAFGCEGATNNPILKQIVDQSKGWLDSDIPWANDAHLGGIGLLCSVLRALQDGACARIVPKLVDRIKALRDRGLGKFSRLNDPDVVYGLAMGVRGELPQDLHDWLRLHCERNAQPVNWRRGLLFAAAASELKGTLAPFAIPGSQLGVHEIFTAIWFAERYPKQVDTDQRRRGLWDAFELIREGVSFDLSPNEAGGLYPASPIDMAMIYEAILHETRDIDPIVLFNNIPWHPQVRQSVQGLFSKGEYVMAVFQAAVAFIDAVKRRANYPVGKAGQPLDGAALMTYAFASRPPKLRFNNWNIQSEKDEQRGLALWAEGIVAAVRNPKGHTPQGSIPLGPQEAIEQLAVISYLFRRLDSAQP